MKLCLRHMEMTDEVSDFLQRMKPSQMSNVDETRLTLSLLLSSTAFSPSLSAQVSTLSCDLDPERCRSIWSPGLEHLLETLARALCCRLARRQFYPERSYGPHRMARGSGKAPTTLGARLTRRAEAATTRYVGAGRRRLQQIAQS